MIEWRDDYIGWGRNQLVRHQVLLPKTPREAGLMIQGSRRGAVLAYGRGRSYGDVALNPTGRLIDCKQLDHFTSFDPATGLLSCEAGVMLADVLRAILRAEFRGQRWFLPVSPGTRFVSIGGAIANDVHGKNHHLFGTFGHHVVELELARSDGQVVRCSLTENAPLFRATIGGLGLTGLILRASIQLRRVPGLSMQHDSARFSGLDEFFALSQEADRGWEYTAAWIDCRAPDGRGVLLRANHAASDTHNGATREPRISVPLVPPHSLVRASTGRAFNALYWRRAAWRSGSKITGFSDILYPLDGILNWNRLYGPRGFFQFQNVLPRTNARDALRAVIREVARSGQGSPLTVLKVFGDEPPAGLLSFPMPGATLAIDFPNEGSATLSLLRRLERITVEAGGRLYAAKDSLMSAETFARGYPEVPQFRPFIDPAFASNFARRVGLVD